MTARADRDLHLAVEELTGQIRDEDSGKSRLLTFLPIKYSYFLVVILTGFKYQEASLALNGDLERVSWLCSCNDARPFYGSVDGLRAPSTA